MAVSFRPPVLTERNPCALWSSTSKKVDGFDGGDGGAAPATSERLGVVYAQNIGTGRSPTRGEGGASSLEQRFSRSVK